MQSLFLFALLPLASALPLWRSLDEGSKKAYTYEHFVEEFGKVPSAGSKRIFEQNLRAVHAHNALNLSWREGINRFSDLNTEELLDFKGLARGRTAASAAGRPTIGASFVGANSSGRPDSVDWRTKKVVTPTKNQGGCGSCWAFSTTEVVESHVAIATGELPVLAPQGLVDCLYNVDQCGGTGGCAGATQELGFAYTMLHGMATEASYPYQAKNGTCTMGTRDAPTAQAPVAGVTGFVKLTANNYDELMDAVATVGPIAISVDASWPGYESGVYKGCSNSSATIDHAVVLVGFGTDAQGGDYYLVRNSWGEEWGEGGYIRLERTDADSTRCVPDEKPMSGSGCASWNDEPITVCGACGVLSDSSYPTGAYLAKK